MTAIEAPSAIEQMLNDLESHMLQTCLAPLRTDMRGWSEFGMKRVNTDENPKWYRRFCSRHESKRKIRRGKFDTKIRRANVLRSLRQIIEGKPPGKYGNELLAIARKAA